MTGYLFRIVALSLAIVAGLALPSLSDGPSETARIELGISDDTLS